MPIVFRIQLCLAAGWLDCHIIIWCVITCTGQWKLVNAWKQGQDHKLVGRMKMQWGRWVLSPTATECWVVAELLPLQLAAKIMQVRSCVRNWFRAEFKSQPQHKLKFVDVANSIQHQAVFALCHCYAKATHSVYIASAYCVCYKQWTVSVTLCL